MDWQSVVAMLAVLAAAVWLCLRAWRLCSRALSGGRITDCAHCPRSAESTQATPLVQLGAGRGERANAPGSDSVDSPR